jgi:predicted kinase
MDQLLIIFRGLPGTGKTFLINKLVSRFPSLVVIDRDKIRSNLFKEPEYTKEENEIIESVMLVLVDENLKDCCSLVIDGMTFSRSAILQPFLNHAIKHNVEYKIIECVCSEKTALERLSNDVVTTVHTAMDRNKESYQLVKKRYEKINVSYLRINTEKFFEINLNEIIDYLES